MSTLTTALLKTAIPGWVTDGVAQRLAAEFIPPLDPTELAAAMREPKNWARTYKARRSDENIERIFNFKPADDQLRLYVVSDPDDRTVLEHTFQTE